ncbi:MAG: serine protease [Desertimonas sp.]|nr:serine protease [Desertimonas sp.]
MTAIQELTTLVRTAVAEVGPSVVSIGRGGRGTGFVVAPGRVVTNAHNLRDRTTSVRFADGRTAQGTVAGSDVDGDLVVLDTDTGDAPVVPWADTPIGEGDVVVAVTAGRHQLRATWGQVTGADRGFRGPRGRRIAGAIEHTAPSPAGSSGAPVLDSTGKVVGVNTHRIDHGFYLARSADSELRDRITAMAEGRRYERVELGVALAPPHIAAKLRRAVGLPERDGLLVRGVADDSPAAAAGIAEGDLLIRAGDSELATVDDLFAALAGVVPGGELGITLVRGSEELTDTASWPAAD